MRTHRSRRKLLSVALCILLVVPSASLRAAPDDVFRYRIANQEQQQLQSMTCASKFNLGIDKIIALANATSNPDSVFAEVLCQPHDHFNSSSIHHVVFCEKSRSSWKCSRSELAIRMDDGTHALIYFEDDIEIEIAYNVAMKLAVSKYYQGEDIPKPESSICNIHHYFNDAGALVSDVYAATCGAQQVLISTWCPQEECPRIIGRKNANN